MMAKQVKPGLIQPKRFMGHRKSADVIRTQPANSIRARRDIPQTKAECMAAISTWRTGIENKGLGKKGRPCIKRDTNPQHFSFRFAASYQNIMAIRDSAMLRNINPLRANL